MEALSLRQTGVYKVAFPPPPLSGNRIKEEKWGKKGREEGRREGVGEGNREEVKGKEVEEGG